MQNDEVKKYLPYLDGHRATFALKRFFDIFVCLLLLLITSPILIICGILVKCTSKGPVFYRQERVGRYDKAFRIFKFRTMVQNADKIGTKLTVGDRDPRITKFGHFLRKTRLDEFPQFLNVLAGHMSLVGPRPEVRRYVDAYTDEMMATLLVRPGITGMASIEFRNENDMLSGKDDPERYYIEEILPKKMQINLEYIKDISIKEDFLILCRTVKCAFV
ncbi:MAG TPA: sugar transferase [Firmicutes bacterium]|nr:sugar transferase [Bacillota bacterium]